MKFLNTYYGFIMLFGLVACVLLYSCFGERGLVNVLSLQQELDEIDNYNKLLEAENEKLQHYIYLLRNDNKVVENIAREELGLVRSGEIVYYFERK